MPIYEYHCTQCQDDFELLIRSEADVECPNCGEQHLEKLLSVPAAHAAQGNLPVCEAPPSNGCGKPACQSGRCMGP